MRTFAAEEPAILRNRFPPPADIFLVFVACSLPVLFWAVLSYLDALPGMLLRMSVWDIVGTTSYVLAFAMLESLVFLVPFVLIAFILPPTFRASHFVALGSVAALITAVWGMFVNLRGFYYGATSQEQFLTGLVLYLVSISVAWLIILRFRQIEEGIRALMERLSVFAYFYLPLACMGAVIVLIRNF